MSSLYVSDPRMWKSFYKNILGGQFDPGSYRSRQVGGGVAGMYSKKPYMIPVNPHISKEPDEKVVGKQVTPVAAAEERARSELKTAVKKDLPHVPKGTIKVNGKQKTVSSKKRRKEETPKTKTGKQIKLDRRLTGPNVFNTTRT
jgi:hypothetical protein